MLSGAYSGALLVLNALWYEYINSGLGFNTGKIQGNFRRQNEYKISIALEKEGQSQEVAHICY